jgi:hypothetical protein
MSKIINLQPLLCSSLENLEMSLWCWKSRSIFTTIAVYASSIGTTAVFESQTVTPLSPGLAVTSNKLLMEEKKNLFRRVGRAVCSAAPGPCSALFHLS